MSIVTTSSSLSALIQEYYMPVLYDNIFKKSHPLLSILKAKAKTFNGRQITVPVEYADGSASAWGDKHSLGDAYDPSLVDIAKTASFTPEMLTGHILLTKEETLLMNSPQAIKNIVSAKVKNLQKGLEVDVASNLWLRTNASNAWLPIDVALSGGEAGVSAGVGGLTVASNAWWATPVLTDASFTDASGDTGSTGVDHISEDDMVDSSKDTYILRMLARGVANARSNTGENPDLIVVPQYVYDLIETELDTKKTGSPLSERMGAMGFTSLNFRGIDIVADQDMVDAQSGNYDGKIFFINTNYVNMFFNSGAKFTASDMIEDTNSNTFVQKVHAYGGMVTSNRKAHCVITDVYSPTSYA
jgi:hypothetical protein